MSTKFLSLSNCAPELSFDFLKQPRLFGAMDHSHEFLANLCESVARKAGERLAIGAKELREVEFLDRNDVKLRADRESETLIRKLLSEGANYPVIGEEEGGDASLVERYEPYWVVDPLDGTYNFLRGAEQCAVSIGLMRGETPILGVIYDFNANVSYKGIVADGLYVNGQLTKPSWASSIDQAVFASGFPAGMDKSRAQMEAFIDRISPYKKVRMIGSAALATAYVAAGKFDVYYEETIRLWDVAAGLALVQAAGGSVRMKASSSGKPFAYDIWAGKGEFFNV